MPTYQYLCRDCDHEFEAIQSMRDDPLTVCPSCGGTLRKVYAPLAISFKGSGFYTTDQRKKPEAAASGAKTPERSSERSKDKPSTAEPSPKPDSKPDSKPTKEAAST